MKKSKLARLIAAICCFAMLLAACSSNQTPAESGGDGSTTSDSEKKVHLRSLCRISHKKSGIYAFTDKKQSPCN